MMHQVVNEFHSEQFLCFQMRFNSSFQGYVCNSANKGNQLEHLVTIKGTKVDKNKNY